MADHSPTKAEAAEQPDHAPDPLQSGSEVPAQDELGQRGSPQAPEFLHPRLRVLQPVADDVKVLLKKDGWSAASADRVTFWIAPLSAVIIALLTYLVLPVGPAFQTSDLNIGLLFILGISSLTIYRIVPGNWSSEHRDSLIGALRSAAQFLSYETAAALGLASVLLLSGSLSTKEIVQAQLDQGQWFIFYVPVGFLIFFICSLATTNRARVSPPETNSEIVAAHVMENRNFHGALDSLAEYANIIVAAGIATTVFLGGWLRPLASYRDRFPGTSVELLDVLPGLAVAAISAYCLRSGRRPQAKIRKAVMNWTGGICGVLAAALLGTLFAPENAMAGVHGAFWFVVKVGAYMYFCLWIRFAFPGLQFDRWTRRSWRILIPAAFINLITAAMAILASQDGGLPMRFTTIVATVATLGAAAWLAKDSPADPVAQTADGG
jgi:NADH-quinone oxidoreductase subunit H